MKHTDYKTWKICMTYKGKSTLWNVINELETWVPQNNISGVIGKWHVKTRCAKFIIKTKVEVEILDHK